MYISSNIPPYKNCKEISGKVKDMCILVKDTWLMNTEVKYRLDKVKGMWQLTMIYVALDNPMQLFCRIIDAYSSKKKAEVYAKILQRAIRKDARGTLKTNKNAFYICDN